MKSLKMKLIYRKHKKAIWGALGAVLLAGLVFFFSYFHVTSVEVMGTTRYSDEEVKAMALQGAFTDNSVLAVLLHSRGDVEDVPFVEGFNITRLSFVGTSLIIIVNVVLETAKSIESKMVAREYESIF